MPSTKILNEKKVLVEALTKEVGDATSIVFADYRGLTVEQDTQLRVALRNAGVEYRVIKNTMLSFAAKNNGLDGVLPFLHGPTAAALSSDPVAPAKILSEFAKKHDKLEIKGGVLEGKVIDVNAVSALAKLPSREELLAMVMGGMQAPVTGLARALNGTVRALAIAINELKKQKESA